MSKLQKNFYKAIVPNILSLIVVTSEKLFQKSVRKTASTEAATGDVLWKKVWRPKVLQLYWKEAPTQIFSCKIWKNFKNTFFEEHLRTIASRSSNFDTLNRSNYSHVFNLSWKKIENFHENNNWRLFFWLRYRLCHWAFVFILS